MICVVTPFLFSIVLGLYVLVKRYRTREPDETVATILRLKDESQDSLAT